MALRTTEAAVKEILDTSATTQQITAFITDASTWVDDELTAAGMSAGRLEIIERYLACALIRLRDLGLKSVRMGDVSEQYQVDGDVTDYLLRAAAFDATGKIRRHFLAPKTARGRVIARVAGGFADDVPTED